MSVSRLSQHSRRVAGMIGSVGTVVLVATIAASTWYAHEAKIHAATPPPVPTVAALPASPAGLLPSSYADLVSRVAPAVVTVHSVRTAEPVDLPQIDPSLRPFFGFGDTPARPRREGGLGSGVVIRPDGYVLTNFHVVDRADSVRVELTDGRSFDAQITGTDPASDLAVLKIPAQNLDTIPFADTERTRVGDVVLAVGNPLGVGQTVTMGIVSGKGRTTGASEGAFEDFIQTDAPINQGNSGGALVNLNGELVGINSQILSPVGYNIGIGFAIPASMAKTVADQLISSGAVRRGMLGVTVQAMTPDLARSLDLDHPTGALVSDVSANSPAAKAGIETGDVILSFDGQPVDGSNSLRNAVAALGPGAHANLTLTRDGRERTVAVTLAELPNQARQTLGRRGSAEHERYGMTLNPLTPETARQLGVENERGAVIADLDPNGRAAEAGLLPGDVIERVNGRTVEDAREAKSALESAAGDKPVRVLVNRHGSRLFVAMPTA